MFTKREYEVLTELCKGCENREIAEKLFISVHTAKAHVASIKSKLKSRNRVESAYLAGKLGLVNDD